MNRRIFLLGTAASLAVQPAAAEVISLDRISRYFNSIRTAEARFRQVNDDGSRSEGRLVMQRPGRIRFDYDDPLDVLVLASGGQIGIFDGASNLSKAERYPLNQTPLALILAREVDISTTSAVRDHYEEDGVTTVVVQDPRRRELGYVELKFRDAPVRLVGWRTIDGGGTATELFLSEFETGRDYPASLFSITREEQRRF
ncbi:MAG: outer membrane lipoprotein carrier protein LolA [Paracoccaceae bacterium]|nr:outer membrane lipoprotein carrier protein LolA [Paracoccaceae bacterium]